MIVEFFFSRWDVFGCANPNYWDSDVKQPHLHWGFKIWSHLQKWWTPNGSMLHRNAHEIAMRRTWKEWEKEKKGASRRRQSYKNHLKTNKVRVREKRRKKGRISFYSFLPFSFYSSFFSFFTFSSSHLFFLFLMCCNVT